MLEDASGPLSAADVLSTDGVSRRAVLLRGTAVAGAVWVAPLVTVLSLDMASAQAASGGGGGGGGGGTPPPTTPPATTPPPTTPPPTTNPPVAGGGGGQPGTIPPPPTVPPGPPVVTPGRPTGGTTSGAGQLPFTGFDARRIAALGVAAAATGVGLVALGGSQPEPVEETQD